MTREIAGFSIRTVLAYKARVRRSQALGLMVGLLLIASVLRWSGMAEMETMLMFDESYNGWDALQLMKSPHLTPFMSGNYGRESGWVYWLIPFLATFGARPFAIHMAATVAGLLTVAAVYRLGVELAGRAVGIWSAAAMTVLYWHVHLSHLGLRAILFALLGTIAIALLLRASRYNRNWLWLGSGVALGLLMYTYFSALLWILYAGLWLLAWWTRDARRRKGATIAFAVTTIVVLPQLLYAAFNPDAALTRIGDVGVFSSDGIGANLVSWLGAWTVRGDGNADLNFEANPILNPVLTVLFLLGLLALPIALRKKAHTLWLFGLAIVSIIPSLISDFAPHFLRAVGLVIPLALVLGVGAHSIVAGARRVLPDRAAVLLPAGMLLFSAGETYRDFQQWLVRPAALSSMEAHVNEAVSWIRNNDTSASSVYFSPFSRFHPIIAFQYYALEPRHVGAFTYDQCVVVPDGPVTYVTIPAYEPEYQRSLSRWLDLRLQYESERTFGGAPLVRIYAGRSRLGGQLVPRSNAPVFADSLEVRHEPIPETVQAGETIPLVLAFRTRNPLPTVYSAFIHLHGDPSPYEGGKIWAQSDSWICDPYPSTLWQPFETVLQEFPVPVPPDTPPGRYSLAIGLYESPAGPRIPLTAPVANPHDFYVVADIAVTSGE